MTKTILPLCLFFCLIFTCCHKDDNDDQKSDCKIITLSSSDGSEQNTFTYNSSGKLSASTSSTDVTNYTYNGNTITAVATYNGQFSFKNIITINSDGLATNVRTELDASGTFWSNDAYEYNGTEVAKETETYSSGSEPAVTTFTWEKDNLISSTLNNLAITFTYYTDKVSKQGDYLQLAALTQGYEVVRTKNMIKSITLDSDLSSFVYTTDSEGNITAITVSGNGDPETLSYQYHCN